MSNRKFFSDNERPKESLRQTQKKKSKRQSKQINKSLTYDKTVYQNAEQQMPVADELEFQLERTSTPNLENMCEHCKHSHMQECCMYVYDTYEDINRYSLFKHGVDEPYRVEKTREDFAMKISATTPSCFPGFTEKNPETAEMRILANNKPRVYLRQFFWPIFMPSTFHPPLPPSTPVYNVPQNIVHDPHSFKYFQSPMFTGNFIPQMTTAPLYTQPLVQIQQQLSVPLQYGSPSPFPQFDFKNHHQQQQPQVIEAHNYHYVPINYFNQNNNNHFYRQQ